MPQHSTREKILNEARKCFAEHGLEGTSLNDIAAGVGIKRPSLLHHFDSKADIYQQVLGVALADWGAKVNKAVEPQLNGWDLVDCVLQSSFDFFKHNPEVVRIFRREALNNKGADGLSPGQILQPFFARGVAFLEHEMDAGRFRRHDAENLLVTGYGAILSYFSDKDLLEGLLGTNPLTEDGTNRRLNHLRDFFSAALEP